MHTVGASLATGAWPLAAPVAEFRQFLADLQTTQGRLAVSVVVLLVALVWVVRVVPWLVGSLGTSGSTDEGDDDAGDAVRSGVRLLAARSLQLFVLLGAAASLVVVWGRHDEALALLDQGGRPAEILGKVVTTLVIGLVTYVAIDVLDEAVARFSEGADRVTDHQEEIVRRMGQLGVIVLALATTLTVWGADLSGLLVGAGFLGIVVGLAARQTLGSLIAGFVLMFSRPFTIGDWVAIGDEEGIVTDITIVNTRLENFDGEFVVIPNDMVANRAITNKSKKGHLRIRLDVGVDYDTDPDRAREVALDAMADVDAIQPTPPPQAILKEFGDSAVVAELRFWIDRPTPPRKWRATNAVVRAVRDAYAREGIKIPFPQRELSGRPETGGVQVRADRPVADARTQGDGDSQSPTATDATGPTSAAGPADATGPTGPTTTGDGSAGDRSAGDGSTGDGSTGDGSADDGSTGDGSTGDGSTGGDSNGEEPAAESDPDD